MLVHREQHLSTARFVSPEQRTQVHDAVVDRLRPLGSALLATPERARQLHAQIDAVLDDVDVARSGRAPGAESGLSRTIGRSRVSEGVAPMESMYAANLLFEVALRILTSADARSADTVLRIAISLNESIMNRVGHAAAAYVDVLLQRGLRAQHDERRRLARDMHDRAAHSVGVALQSLELHKLYAEAEPERAAMQLDATRQNLDEALQTIRALATEVRDALGGRDLGTALRSYVDRFAGPRIRSSVEVTGDLCRLSPLVAEELFLIVREAIYNTFLHADASCLDVLIDVRETAVIAEVVDDGSGFDPAYSAGIGLASMRERLDALGGRLELTTSTSRGTGVRAVIPTEAGA